MPLPAHTPVFNVVKVMMVLTTLELALCDDQDFDDYGCHRELLCPHTAHYALRSTHYNAYLRINMGVRA